MLKEFFFFLTGVILRLNFYNVVLKPIVEFRKFICLFHQIASELLPIGTE